MYYQKFKEGKLPKKVIANKRKNQRQSFINRNDQAIQSQVEESVKQKVAEEAKEIRNSMKEMQAKLKVVVNALD